MLTEYRFTIKVKAQNFPLGLKIQRKDTKDAKGRKGQPQRDFASLAALR